MVKQNFEMVKLDEYEEFIGARTVERILKKARPLQGAHLAHVNSTYYGGGVAEMTHIITVTHDPADAQRWDKGRLARYKRITGFF